ncbi:MAG: hypothetical protein Ta2A_05700 [Treponemataceae bacterium]|nr:MAG: hypothetical protein Ta2A_05700 [Treponemataceae bacterium]
MEDTLEQLTNVLRDGKAENITLLDVSSISSWTDFLFIATVSSSAHLRGLLDKVEECGEKAGLKKRLKTEKKSTGAFSPASGVPTGAQADWNFVDFGSIVVHLMSEDARPK